MKKVYYNKVSYTTITKFVTIEGEVMWLRRNYLTIKQAKEMYLKVKSNIGAKAHIVGNSCFEMHMPNSINGYIENILLEEIRNFYFE